MRFDFFCKAALEFLLKTGRNPDILHCHDWSTAHVAKSFWEDYQPYGLSKPKVLAGTCRKHAAACRKLAGSMWAG